MSLHLQLTEVSLMPVPLLQRRIVVLPLLGPTEVSLSLRPNAGSKFSNSYTSLDLLKCHYCCNLPNELITIAINRTYERVVTAAKLLKCQLLLQHMEVSPLLQPIAVSLQAKPTVVKRYYCSNLLKRRYCCNLLNCRCYCNLLKIHQCCDLLKYRLCCKLPKGNYCYRCHCCCCCLPFLFFNFRARGT